ncbi:peroxisomal multifunctional enzyme type 2-like isoform X2 [Schistocerca gregaria]|nr:peroxisomal multifunctional enzyme type 2-like isoform X2 [Schistocerca gregaria]
MKDQDWDLVYQVHLKGTYRTTKAAWEHMVKQKYGRIIMVTSAAGLYGNFGQSNYAAMKLGILGFANTLAIEGKKHNITVNTISPLAGSRMTETIMPPELVKALKPEFVTPLVAYLSHESNRESGGVFEVGAGWVSRVRWQRTEGVIFDASKIDVDDVRKRWGEINDWGRVSYPKSSTESLSLLMEKVAKKGSGGSNRAVDVDVVLNHVFDEKRVTVTKRDVMLYAVSLGESEDPLNLKELKYVYENHEEFGVIPSMGVTYPLSLVSDAMKMPGLKFDLMQLLHGEQHLKIYGRLPTEGEVVSKGKVRQIYDKGTGALVILETKSYDSEKRLLCENEVSLFIRGIGGFGNAHIREKKNEELVMIPNREPDKIQKYNVGLLQALLYRLAGGDMNPLHIDPNMSQLAGFKRPILHGLCTMGIATRAILKHYGSNRDITEIKVRFSKPVFPGETLQTEMWEVSSDLVAFQVRILNRNELALTNCFARLGHFQSSSTSSPPPSSSSTSLQSAPIFDSLQHILSSDRASSLVQSTQAVYQFKLLDAQGNTHIRTLDLKNHPGRLYSGDAPSNNLHADTTFELRDSDFLKLATGKLNAQTAFLQGVLKIHGNISLATKLDQLFGLLSSKL